METLSDNEKCRYAFAILELKASVVFAVFAKYMLLFLTKSLNILNNKRSILYKKGQKET